MAYSKSNNGTVSSKNSGFASLMSNPAFFIGYSVMLVVVVVIVVGSFYDSRMTELEIAEKRVEELNELVRNLRGEVRVLKQSLNSKKEDQGQRLVESGGHGETNIPKPSVRHSSVQNPSVPSEPSGKFVRHESKSPIDDSLSIVLSCPSNERHRSSYRNRPTLIVRYKEKERDIYVDFDDFLGTGETQITFRFDRDQALTTAWGVSTDHKAAFYRGDISWFINRLRSARKFTVRVTPYSDSPRVYTFDVANFSSEISPVSHLFR